MQLIVINIFHHLCMKMLLIPTNNSCIHVVYPKFNLYVQTANYLFT